MYATKSTRNLNGAISTSGRKKYSPKLLVGSNSYSKEVLSRTFKCIMYILSVRMVPEPVIGKHLLRERLERQNAVFFFLKQQNSGGSLAVITKSQTTT